MSGSELLKIARAATQLTPASAAMMRYIDEKANEEEVLKKRRFVQVVEFKLEQLSDRLDEIDECRRVVANIVSAKSIEQSHIHSLFCALIATNAALTHQEIIGRYYIQRIELLDYIELSIIYDKAGLAFSEIDEHLALELDTVHELRKSYPENLKYIELGLVNSGLIMEDNSIDKELVRLLISN